MWNEVVIVVLIRLAPMLIITPRVLPTVEDQEAIYGDVSLADRYNSRAVTTIFFFFVVICSVSSRTSPPPSSLS